MDNSDRVGLGIRYILYLCSLSVDLDRSSVREMDSTENLDQSGFAGTVLAQQSVDFTLLQIETNVVQSDHATEPFPDPSQCQHRGVSCCRLHSLSLFAFQERVRVLRRDEFHANPDVLLNTFSIDMIVHLLRGSQAYLFRKLGGGRVQFSSVDGRDSLC